jgi:DNA repair exonuclease SbcCD ATPase subunit
MNILETLDVGQTIAKYHKLVGMQSMLTAQKEKTEHEVEALRELSLAIESASTLIQDTAKETQEKIRVHLNSLVTKALQAVYPEDIHFFDLKFVSERGQTSIYPTLIKGENELDPLDNSGGMAEIIAFALRIALMTIGKKAKILILDEPFTGVSAIRIPLVQDFLQEISKDLGIQILITSHIPGFTSDNCRLLEIRKEDDVSVVTIK